MMAKLKVCSVNSLKTVSVGPVDSNTECIWVGYEKTFNTTGSELKLLNSQEAVMWETQD